MQNNRSDKRIEKGEQTRTRILDAALTIIAEEGIKEVSAAKIAKEIGSSKSNIFHHFKSIDHILIDVLRMIFNELLASISTEFRDVDQFLHTLGQSVLQVPEEHRKLFKAFYSFYHEGLFNEQFRQELASYERQITEIIHNQLRTLASDSIPQETIHSVAILILPMMDGLGMHYLIHGNGTQYERAWSLQVRSIVQLLSE